MKLPGWSSMLIVPALILAASFSVIRRSESPVSLAAIVIVTGVVVGGLSWGILSAIDRFRRR